MSQQTTLIFVLDLVTALVLSVALTAIFARTIRARGCRGWHDISATVWLATLGFWLLAMTIVAFSALDAPWLPFVFIGLSLGLLFFYQFHPSLLSVPSDNEKRSKNESGRPAIIQFFFVTVLLLLCAISFHFYIVNLG